MLLTRLHLENFRNIRSAALDLSGNSHFFLGPNGQGKTNLLEAAGMVTALRSFRARESAALIRHSTDNAGLYYQLNDHLRGESTITLHLTQNGKRLTRDGEAVHRLADHIGQFPTCTLSSDDIQLIRSNPALRRRFLDSVFASIDRTYFEALQRTQRALLDRNRLLKNPQTSTAQLDSFDKTLAPPASALIRLRREGIEALSKHFVLAYTTLAAGREVPSLIYTPDCTEETPEGFLQALLQSRSRDLKQKTSQCGPHRDDFILLLDGQPARDFASEGQQRGLVSALRLAQIALIRERTGLMPVILADDILGELDDERREGFWKAVGSSAQIIATGTQPPPVLPGRLWTTWHVRHGTFTREDQA